jgi:hypothetical protein
MEPTRDPVQSTLPLDSQWVNVQLSLDLGSPDLPITVGDIATSFCNDDTCLGCWICRPSGFGLVETIKRISGVLTILNEQMASGEYELVGSINLKTRRKVMPAITTTETPVAFTFRAPRSSEVEVEETSAIVLSDEEEEVEICCEEPVMSSLIRDATAFQVTTRRAYASNRCVICFSKVKDDDYGKSETPCGCSGMYHYECLSQWVEINHTCPMCRSCITSGQELRVEVKRSAPLILLPECPLERSRIEPRIAGGSATLGPRPMPIVRPHNKRKVRCNFVSTTTKKRCRSTFKTPNSAIDHARKRHGIVANTDLYSYNDGGKHIYKCTTCDRTTVARGDDNDAAIRQAIQHLKAVHSNIGDILHFVHS